MAQQSDNLGDEYLIPSYGLLDAGLFATTSKALGAWTLSGGVRADIRWLRSEALAGRFEAFSRRFPGVSASLGAVRPLGDHFTFRANVARGFRAPNLAELGSNGEHEGTFRFEVGNKDLKPEYSLQGDLGLDFSSRHVSIQAALFVSRIDNYIFAARNGTMSDEGLPVYVFQSGLAHLHGGEIGFDVHPVHSLHLSSAFSCVFAREAGGDNLPLIPAPRLFSEIKARRQAFQQRLCRLEPGLEPAARPFLWERRDGNGNARLYASRGFRRNGRGNPGEETHVVVPDRHESDRYGIRPASEPAQGHRYLQHG